MTHAWTPELGTLALTSGTTDYTQSPSFGVLYIMDDTIVANNAKTSELGSLAIVSEVPDEYSVPQTSLLGVLVIYGEGAQEDFRLRAWGFTMDGHRFYVLHIGEQGTWVYDFTTKQWAEWKSQGFDNGWNAYIGFNWGADDRIIAADRQNPLMWEINPETFVDEEYKTITREVTAIIPQSGFSWRTLDSVSLYASVGDYSTVAPTIELTFSDDQGKTWDAPADSIIVLVEGEDMQALEWMSLGSFQSPGRIINILDYGGSIRIDRAVHEVR